MIKKIRISKIFLSIFLFISIVNAEELDLNLKSERYILYNLDNDSIIVEKDAYSKTNVASLTKIMSTIVSIENAKDYNSDITITSDMISGIAADVAKVGLKKGQKVKYDDLIAGSLISSGADAIQALSIYSNGTLKNTIGLMNTKVSELGLKSSNFTNVVGLYDKYNYSSAYDMAQILKYALKNDRFKKIFTSNTYEMSYGKKISSSISKYNKKAKQDISYILGSKTGYIKKAGYCLASIATINDVNYLLITLNAYNDSTAHIDDSIKIYEYVSKNYDYIDIFKEGDVIYTIDTYNSTIDKYEVKAPYTKTLFLNKDFDKDNLKYNYDGNESVSYLNKKGEKLGKIQVMYNDEQIDEFDVVLDSELSFSLDKYFVKYKVILILFTAIIATIVVGLIVRVKIKSKVN